MNGAKARKRTRLRSPSVASASRVSAANAAPDAWRRATSLSTGSAGDPPPGVAGSAEIEARERGVPPAEGEEVDAGARSTSRLLEARDPRRDPVGRDVAHRGAAERRAKGVLVDRRRHRAAHVGVVERGQPRIQRDERDLARRRQGDLGSTRAQRPDEVGLRRLVPVDQPVAGEHAPCERRRPRARAGRARSGRRTPGGSRSSDVPARIALQRDPRGVGRREQAGPVAGDPVRAREHLMSPVGRPREAVEAGARTRAGPAPPAGASGLRPPVGRWACSGGSPACGRPGSRSPDGSVLRPAATSSTPSTSREVQLARPASRPPGGSRGRCHRRRRAR